jgi:hypothetical protein
MSTEEKRVEVAGIDADTYAGKAAAAVRIKARGVMGDHLLTFHLMDMVQFMILNNEFMTRGIYITDDNREESYLKIIETGDDTLLEKLEQYLNIKDAVADIQKKREEYQEIIDKLNNLSDHNDREAVNAIVEDYLRR